MSVMLAATTTGSTSVRLTWDPAQAPGATFTVYRGATAVFGSATALGSALPAGTPWFNDYTAAPSSTYYYWIEDQSSNVYGPASATTIPATVNQDAIDEAQLNAIFDWAYSVWGGLYPAQWRNQAAAEPLKPWIGLNILAIRGAGGTDGAINDGEGIAGGRVATVSVATFASPTPPLRGLLNVASLAAGTYTVTANGTPYSVVYGATPTTAQVLADLQAQLNPPGTQNFQLLEYGLDPVNQGLIVENYDPTGPLVVSVTGNLTWSTYRPPKAMTLAQRLQASLGDPAQLDALDAIGIGVGTRNPVQDVSVALDTEMDQQASFDFFINVAEIYPVAPGVIDTVQIQAPPSNFVS